MEIEHHIVAHPMEVHVALLEHTCNLLATEFDRHELTPVDRELMRQLLHLALEALGED